MSNSMKFISFLLIYFELLEQFYNLIFFQKSTHLMKVEHVNTTELFTEKNNQILFDSCDLQEIANKFGTPSYIFSLKRISENIEHLQMTFKKYYPDSTIAYSTKNNMIPEIISFIANKLEYFETTSLNELKLIEEIILSKEKSLNLISTNLFKSDDLISNLIHYPNINAKKINTESTSGIIAIDSFQDLKNVERVAKSIGKKANVIIRVNPGIEMSRDKTIFASAYPSAKCSTII